MLDILLLNPPGESKYLRDYYRSKTSKSDYSYTPVDFLFIGALLDKHCNLTFLDCVNQNISREQPLSITANSSRGEDAKPGVSLRSPSYRRRKYEEDTFLCNYHINFNCYIKCFILFYSSFLSCSIKNYFLFS